MSRYFSLVVMVAFAMTFATEDCATAITPSIIQSLGGDGLRRSNDKGVQAAGNSSDGIDLYKARQEAEGKALNSNNLRMAEKIDFTSIDQLVKSYGYEQKYYHDRAAMKVAAGKDEASIRQDQGMALDALKKKNSSGNDQANVYEYMGSLANVQTGLVKGTPAWTRVHDALCAQQTLYKANFKPDAIYSEDVDQRINNALADSAC